MMTPDKIEAIRRKAEALGGGNLGEQGDLLVEMAAQRACAYCQRPDIPTEMEQAVAALALAMQEVENVKTIQRGDTSVTYAVAEAVLKAPESLLKPFCRLGRVE